MCADDRLHRLNEALAGRYTIDREIGRGGMATVYLAHDLRHDRLVAIKVLAPELGAALGPERFLSEIHVTAALQHPNLLPLFDSGGDGDLLWYVMPYVEGESLRARLDRERELPIDRATHIAASVAAALDYAHRHGVIHRDLKPENILLHDGEPLVADFGIALAISHASGARVTQTGFSLGTPSYMSPEQAAGERNIDGRSDVYALGCVLYEMLTGEPPYSRSDPQALLARIMTEPVPSVRARRPSVPVPVESTVTRALAKIPADRFETAREFGDALTSRTATSAVVEPINTPEYVDTHHAAARPRYRDPVVLALAAMAVLSLASAAWLATQLRARPAPRSVRFVASEPGETASSIAVSPAGDEIAYSVESAMGTHLALRTLGELHARTLAGTDQALNPFFSPDGRWVAFVTADDRLEKVPVDGGEPVVIAPSWRFGHGAWAPDGRIVFTDDENGLATVAANGGTPSPLTKLDERAGEARHSFPVVVAGGSVIFVVTGESSSGTKFTDLAITPFAHAGSAAAYTRLGVHAARPLGVIDDWLLYVSSDETSIMAVRFDAARRSVSGDPVIVLHESGGKLGGVSLSERGTLAYTPTASPSAGSGVVLVDLHGAAVPLDTVHGLASHMQGGMYFRLSPDGRRLAFMAPQANGHWTTLVEDLASGTLSRVGVSRDAYYPEWTSDGSRIFYGVELSNDVHVLASQSANGSGTPEIVAHLPVGNIYQLAITSDGRTGVVQVTDSSGRSRLWLVQTGSAQPPRLLSQGAGNEAMPRLSPDGHLLAYTSDETGEKEVYLRSFPGAAGQMQISEHGGVEPMWSADGRRVFYRNGAEMWEASLAAPALTVTSRRLLFRSRFIGGMPHADYAVMPDGAHFVMAVPHNTPSGVVVVVDWLTELHARLTSASD